MMEVDVTYKSRDVLMELRIPIEDTAAKVFILNKAAYHHPLRLGILRTRERPLCCHDNTRLRTCAVTVTRPQDAPRLSLGLL